MRAQLLHLTGPLRGRTRTYSGRCVLIGCGPDSDVRFDQDAQVVARHAEIEFLEPACAFHLRPLDGRVFVNRHEIEEVVLEDGDLIEFGVDGPRAKFRIHVDPGSVCKPVRHMLRDAKSVGDASGPVAFSQSMVRDLLEHATLQLKIGVPIVLLLLAAAAFVAGRLSGPHPENGSAGSDSLAAYASEIQALRDEVAKLRDGQAFSRTEVESLRGDLEARSEALDKLQQRGVAVARVHDIYARGVCLIHGAYGYSLPGQPKQFVADASGKSVSVEYTGTGFLISADGRVATNRHVALPWDYDERARSLIEAGFVPKMFSFTATFPGDDRPRAIDPATVRVRADRLDVAIVRIGADREIPVLTLSDAYPSSFRGSTVLVVGYPTGVNQLLAKADRSVVEAVTHGSPGLGDVIARLAAHHAISPVITSGVLGEVREEKLVYDASTTSGGSGGPVFSSDGEVIGVNFAILRGFAGSNFGIPIRFAAELLKE